MEGDFKTLFRRFCLDSSILGLKYFYIYPDTISRLFWAITMALILYMACLLTWLLHERFEEMPTRIAIENQYEPVRNLTFPAIIICSPNQITISAMKHFNKTLVEGKRALNLKIILPQLLGFYELVGDLSPRDLENLQNLITLNRYNSLEVMGMLPQSCDDFLKLCFFKGKRYPNCQGLFNPILTKRGMCCTFNSKYHYKKNKRNERIFNFKPETTSKTGLRESLIVVADYNPDDALAGTILNAGAIRLMFTDWTEFPADDESNLVHPNSESFHIIHPTYTYCSEDVMTLPAWSRKCYFEDGYTLPHFRKYHKSDCNLLCHVNELERLCHCTMIYVPNLYLSRACNVTSIDCIVKAKMQMNKWYRTEQCDCPRDCVSFRYRVEMILGNIDALPHIMFNPYSDIVFNKTTTIMQFLVPSPVYVKQKQETVMSLITLSSNLGGVFGLCLGCSAISMLEMYFYIYLLIKNNIKKRLQNVLKNKVDSE
nr:sodium channel protein Nach-like [Vanessa tameamea]